MSGSAEIDDGEAPVSEGNWPGCGCEFLPALAIRSTMGDDVDTALFWYKTDRSVKTAHFGNVPLAIDLCAAKSIQS
jgi:hypothetical protein